VTAIIGYIDADGIWMIADSMASDGHIGRAIKTPKITRVGNALVGTAGSPLLKDIIAQHIDELNVFEGHGDRNNVLLFVSKLKQLLVDDDILKEYEGEKLTPDFSSLLVAYDQALYEVQHNFTVIEYAEQYGAIGAGQEMALGIVEAMIRLYSMDDPRHSLNMAMQIISRFVLSVGPPFFTAFLPGGDPAP
jgi:ATP-dependent protease HslVU (ClpYQ) peptidase subunit